MKYSKDWLKAQINSGIEPNFFFFWGHTPKQEGVTDKSCLSQWFPQPFEVDEVMYATAEHWMMAGKAKLFNDAEALSKILATPKPGTAKAIGREVRNFDDKVWKQHAYDIVVEGSYHKFSQNESLKNFLLRTGNKIIVEASPRDCIWGIGLSQSSEKAMSPSTWRGTNLLGFALMEARDRLLNQHV
jgi:ribA/ribD-fused uncharacterized protein